MGESLGNPEFPSTVDEIAAQFRRALHAPEGEPTIVEVPVKDGRTFRFDGKTDTLGARETRGVNATLDVTGTYIDEQQVEQPGRLTLEVNGESFADNHDITDLPASPTTS